MLYKNILLFASVVILSGCKSNEFTDIKSILENPAAYRTKVVKIRGKVSSTLILPLVGTKTYKVTDTNGEITIVTSKTLPKKDEMVVVTGNVTNTMTINGESAGIQIDEIQRQ